MSRMDDAAIREAMARAEKATPGCGCKPEGWTTLPGHGAVIGAGDCLHHVCSSSYVSEFADPICEFIAAARTDVPALAAEALARGEEIAALERSEQRLAARVSNGDGNIRRLEREAEGLRAEVADTKRRAKEAEAQIKRARDYVDDRGIARGLGGHYGLREVIKQQIARAEAAEAEVARLRAAALPEDAEERIKAALRDRDIRTIMGGSPAYGDDARAILEALRGDA